MAKGRTLLLRPRVVVAKDPKHELLTHQVDSVMVAVADPRDGHRYILGISSHIGNEGPLGGYYQHVTRGRAKEIVRQSARRAQEMK